MLLEKLVEYSKNLNFPPTMYQETEINFILEIDSSGRFLNCVRTAGEEDKKERGKRYIAPHAQATSGTTPKLLVGQAEYVLGLVGKDEDRAKERHKAFLKLVGLCIENTGDPKVKAVGKFLESIDLTKLPIPEDLGPNSVLTFLVDGEFPFLSESVKEFWAHYQAQDLYGSSERETCLVCGENKVPVRIHPIKIKGMSRLGGQPSGTAMVSANNDAFYSYGLESSLIAPTCLSCSERYATALNSLILDKAFRIYVGPVVYVFWTKERSNFSIATLLTDPDPNEVKKLIKSAYTGKETVLKVDTNPFYATALSASGGRTVVRDWLETTVDNVQKNLASFFALQRIVEWDGSGGKPYGIFPLSSSLVADANRDLPPNIPKAFLRCAVLGSRLPDWILHQAVKRNRAEQRLTRPRAAVIKMVLESQNERIHEEDTMEKLDEKNTHPAYLCGRLLAVLDSIQRRAVNPEATIVDRYYGTASSAPASVFGNLLHTSMAHLGKLRRERPGAFHSFSQRIEEITEDLKSFPRTLTLEEQGLFALGFYHQKAADGKAAREYADLRNEGESQ